MGSPRGPLPRRGGHLQRRRRWVEADQAFHEAIGLLDGGTGSLLGGRFAGRDGVPQLVVTNPEAEAIIAQYTGHIIEGGPEKVREEILEAVGRYGTMDIGIATTPYGFEDRVRSYELIAEIFKGD